MEELMSFFKDIFTTESTMKVGLSQFKDAMPAPIVNPVRKEKKKETKISDLMRGI